MFKYKAKRLRGLGLGAVKVLPLNLHKVTTNSSTDNLFHNVTGRAGRDAGFSCNMIPKLGKTNRRVADSQPGRNVRGLGVDSTAKNKDALFLPSIHTRAPVPTDRLVSDSHARTDTYILTRSLCFQRQAMFIQEPRSTNPRTVLPRPRTITTPSLRGAWNNCKTLNSSF